MDDRELMQQALEALEIVTADVKTTPSAYEAQRQAITALRERLAQPEQEPVFDCPRCGHCCPQSKPLTDEEIERACVPLGAAVLSFTEVARAIEAKLKEKNT